MELNRTTILSSDPTEACARLRERIELHPHVHLVVVGDSVAVEQVVQRAARLAGDETSLRWVIWARNLDLIRPVVDELKGPKRLRQRILDGGAQVFALSYDDTICDVVLRTETANNVRLMAAFACAEINA